MREVAGVAPRLLGLFLAMDEQLVQFVDQREDLAREVFADPALRAGTNGDNLLPHAPQGPKSIESLERGQDKQPDAQRGERTDQGRPQLLDLAIDDFARLGDLESPTDIGARKYNVALDNAQRLILEFTAIVGVESDVVMRWVDAQAPVPQGA